MKNNKRLTLYRPATYQIKVPGELNELRSDWGGRLTVTIECDENDLPITTLTGVVDQAALHGILRRLYSLGLPLISVKCFEVSGEE